ncbi:MAG TPA: PIN domain-containing protein [Gemmatimonadales bacterium]|nr:PIN domain-containing protein [Gemmatimonadales bacterium]
MRQRAYRHVRARGRAPLARSARLTTVADTGAIYALLDRRDAWHERVRGWWESGTGEVLLPVTILPEITYLVQRRKGIEAETGFVRAVAVGELTVEPLEPGDFDRSAELMQDYRDLPLGFVDATVVAVAERLDAGSVLTTDRRHFAIVRPRHVERLRLAPA